jgi:hypothetical protein
MRQISRLTFAKKVIIEGIALLSTRIETSLNSNSDESESRFLAQYS